jgi:hypothetical protein
MLYIKEIKEFFLAYKQNIIYLGIYRFCSQTKLVKNVFVLKILD